MNIETSEILSFLEEFCLSADDKILGKMKDLCIFFEWNAEHVVDQWVAFSMSTSKQCLSPTLPLLEQMENEELMKKKNPKGRKSASGLVTPVYTANDIHLISDNFGNSDKENTNNVNGLNGSPMFSSQFNTPTRFTPSRKYGSRSGSGGAVCSFGDCSNVDWKQSEEFSCNISVYNEKFALRKSYTYMNEKLRDRASILNDMIQSAAELYRKEHNIEEWGPIHLPSAAAIPVVGRICSESVGRLDASSLLLEGSQELSSGQVVPLDVSVLESFSFFPGQIIAGMGMNSLGKKLILKNLFEPAPPEFSPRVPDLANCFDSLNVVVACGPFATSDTFSYEPLWDLFKYVQVHKPHVLILIGPFVDVKNEAIENGQLNDTYEAVFKKVISEILKHIEELSLKVVLVPSARDAHHDCIYPTPPYFLDHTPKRLFLASDPCILNIEGVVFAITSTDILFHLGKEEISHPQLPDRFGRLCKHILTQRNLYPLYPYSEDISIDFLHYELHSGLPIMPHVLIVPSDFRYFIKEVNGCCCINPERLTKHSTGGTFARLKVKRPDVETYQGSISKSVLAQVLKI